jgi:hypothetical protein
MSGQKAFSPLCITISGKRESAKMTEASLEAL